MSPLNVAIAVFIAFWVDILLAHLHFERVKDGNASFVTLLWLSGVSVVLVTLLFVRFT